MQGGVGGISLTTLVLIAKGSAGAGYSLSIFIPVCVLCLIRLEVVRWVLIGVATASSGLFLMMNFRRPLFDTAGAK